MRISFPAKYRLQHVLKMDPYPEHPERRGRQQCGSCYFMQGMPNCRMHHKSRELQKLGYLTGDEHVCPAGPETRFIIPVVEIGLPEET